jgi:hypothetical protein
LYYCALIVSLVMLFVSIALSVFLKHNFLFAMAIVVGLTIKSHLFDAGQGRACLG